MLLNVKKKKKCMILFSPWDYTCLLPSTSDEGCQRCFDSMSTPDQRILPETLVLKLCFRHLGWCGGRAQTDLHHQFWYFSCSIKKFCFLRIKIIQVWLVMKFKDFCSFDSKMIIGHIPLNLAWVLNSITSFPSVPIRILFTWSLPPSCPSVSRPERHSTVL